APDLSRHPLHFLTRTMHQVWFFHLVCFGWIIFRAKDFTMLAEFLAAFSRDPIFDFKSLLRLGLALPVFVLEYFIDRWHSQEAFLMFPWPIRAVGYVGMYFGLMVLGKWGGNGFIYFQF